MWSAIAICIICVTAGLDAHASAALEQPDLATRGAYLARAGNCVSCHTRPGGEPFAGGLAFATPLGVIHSTNITPDPETGIGKWTEADLLRAMHEGRTPDGRHLFPAFPYTAFTKITDEDVKAIHAYLRTVTPVRYTPPANSAIFRLRWGMAIWNALFFSPGRFQKDRSRSDEWNRGAYLTEALGHCGACHTPRDRFMAEISEQAHSGGSVLDHVAEGTSRRWHAVNLTPAKGGLAAWSVDDIASYLKTGFSERGGAFGPMNDVIVNSTRHLTDEDVHAIAVYLKALPPREVQTAAVTSDQLKPGEQIYEDRCKSCHMASGRGGFLTGPALEGSAIVQGADPSSLINLILYGPDPNAELGESGWETMKPFGNTLTDAEVAAVATYTRGMWGNKGGPVTAADVAKQR